ncbi:siderophore-iron reductase FhuF [Rhodopseudomonas sp. HC1]|uniref:siderophore-iron reductase FhuF n=1 Tax=Rhodopseudomonas infernalis TaxID=2897386 RepID=UPI001EE8C6A5|nr:siderophore-iron reductase FhuF [Rhodopseudomonas infernalis]MCG6204136.1 siderophore-iron reductase FhuF [Rhodopseudomonas infernalis]
MTAIPPAAICRAIDDLATGHEGTASFAGGLVGPDDARLTVPATALLDARHLALVNARFARRFDQFDARATHSIWMKWYLNVMLPPVLLADVCLRRSVAVGLDEVRFIVAEDGRVDANQIRGESLDTEGLDPFARFQSLVFDHLTPLIDLLAVRTDVTRRVYWSNVGNTYEAMLRRIEAVAGPSRRLAEAQELLATPRWPDGRTNPLADAVGYPGGLRLRRICCLQYLLPDRRFCSACPVPEARVHPHPAGRCN